MKNLLYQTLTFHKDLTDGQLDDQDTSTPLSIWNNSIEKLTSVKKEDIKKIYIALIENLNETCYKQKLDADPTLFM